MKTRNTCTSDCRYRHEALCRRGCSVVFSRVTLFSFYSNQSDAVQSGGAFSSANRCFPKDVMVIAGYSGLFATDPLQVYRRCGCRRVNAGSGWQDGRCRSLRCEMYPHRRVVGALFVTISASRGGQMYHALRSPFQAAGVFFTATRRRSSQAVGSLVVVMDDRTTWAYYQRKFVTVNRRSW